MRVAFRVDASQEIGTGHFMRCLCLADGLHQRGAAIRFVSRLLPAHLCDMLTERGYELISLDLGRAGGGGVGRVSGVDADAQESALALAPGPWDWLVVDHYGLDARWEASLRDVAVRLLVIDDLANRPHDCDVLVDQNLYADTDRRYAGRVPEHCEMLLGPSYALLRDEFRRARAEASPRAGHVTRVFVSFGGADSGNRTALAVEVLAACGLAFASVDVVIGAGHTHRGDIETACRRHGFHCHVQSSRLAELMAAADLAVGAGGTTVWERCCMGLPAIVLPSTANQDAMVAEAARRGLLYDPDGGAPATAAALAVHIRALADNVRLREMLSHNGLQAVDGRGVERVMRVLDPDICMREATLDDAEALFQWRNHETVRGASRHTDPIARPEHDAWLRAALADPDRLLLIAERDGAPIGVVRFDIVGGRAEVSVYRVPDAAGGGVGTMLMRMAERWLRERRPDVACVTADVLGDNERSHRMLRANGYRYHHAVYEKSLRES